MDGFSASHSHHQSWRFLRISTWMIGLFLRRFTRSARASQLGAGMFYARNHPQHTSTHEVCIQLDHLSTGVPKTYGSGSCNKFCNWLDGGIDGASVISARVFRGGEIFVIPAISPFFLLSHHLYSPSHYDLWLNLVSGTSASWFRFFPDSSPWCTGLDLSYSHKLAKLGFISYNLLPCFSRSSGPTTKSDRRSVSLGPLVAFHFRRDFLRLVKDTLRPIVSGRKRNHPEIVVTCGSRHGLPVKSWLLFWFRRTELHTYWLPSAECCFLFSLHGSLLLSLLIEWTLPRSLLGIRPWDKLAWTWCRSCGLGGDLADVVN